MRRLPVLRPYSSRVASWIGITFFVGVDAVFILSKVGVPSLL